MDEFAPMLLGDQQVLHSHFRIREFRFRTGNDSLLALASSVLALAAKYHVASMQTPLRPCNRVDSDATKIDDRGFRRSSGTFHR